jgi:asparagine synthetase B (glutamine-hydrolysing)
MKFMNTMSTRIEIEPCQPFPLFQSAEDATSGVRKLTDYNNRTLNEKAIYSLLQFGAIIPPLAAWNEIARLLPGFLYDGANLISPVKLTELSNIRDFTTQQKASLIETTLDGILKNKLGACSNPVLLFSGGVDSGILASRLAQLGYHDSQLINFSFGVDDRESQLAEAMAKTLNLKFRRVQVDKLTCACLEKPGRVYPQPFSDHSVVPSQALAKAVIEELGGTHRVILDGTGADGAFGLLAKITQWSRVSKTPQPIKMLAGQAYEKLQLWKRDGKLEYSGRILKRLHQMPVVSAFIAQNPLGGVFYHDDHRVDVDHLLCKWISGWAGTSLMRQVVAADMAFTGTNIFAQKMFPLFQLAGHRVIFPFLEKEMVQVALSAAEYWMMSEPKEPLKISLARHVPQNMVYRKKSGFVDPKAQVFYQSEFIEYLRSAIDSSGPLADILIHEPLLNVCDLLRKEKTLPYQTRNCIWSVVFADRWYRTYRS